MSLEHYRDVAIQAVTNIRVQNPSPVYGYLRRGAHQKIYLFPSELDARTWFDQRTRVESEHDYAAVFGASDLRTPLAEDLGRTGTSPANVGHWFWPLAFGVPAGALGGYHYRKWQETHPGEVIPWISGEDVPDVGGSWVGASADLGETGRRQEWLKTKALIQSAISEVIAAHDTYPAQAYVWSLDLPGAPPSAHVELFGTTTIIPFASHTQALAYMRDRVQTPHVALALFDATSPRWPNPVNWTKSHDPAHEHVISQQIAKHAPQQGVGGEPWMNIVGGEPWMNTVGGEPWMNIVGGEPWMNIVGGEPWMDIVGGEPWMNIVGGEPNVGEGSWNSIVGQTLAVLRRQAKVAAEEMPGPAIGTRRGVDKRWLLKAFRSVDDADDWFGHAIADPRDFTYAAYFSKDRHGIPFLENEEIGKARAPLVRRPPIRREIATVTVSP